MKNLRKTSQSRLSNQSKRRLWNTKEEAGFILQRSGPPWKQCNQNNVSQKLREICACAVTFEELYEVPLASIFLNLAFFEVYLLVNATQKFIYHQAIPKC